MAAKAALLRVIAACLACAAAERNNLNIVAHTPEPNDPAADDGLSYGGLGEWHSKALGKLDAFTSSVGAELESATAGALSESQKYSQMMHGLEGGFETFKGSVDSFRSANIHTQGKSNEEVRQVLKSARRTAMEDQATVEAESGAKTVAKANATAEAAGYWQDQARAETESEETAEAKDEDEEKEEWEASHKAENLTSPNVSVPPSSAGVKNLEPEEEEEETSGLKPLFEEEEQENLKPKVENPTSSNVSNSPSSADFKNLEPEEEVETSGLKPLFEEEEEEVEGVSHKAETPTSSNVSKPPSSADDKNLEMEEEEGEEETSGLKPLFEEEEGGASHKAETLTSSNVSKPPSSADTKNLEPKEEEEEELPLEKVENPTSSNVSKPPSSADVKNLEPEEEVETSGIKPLFEEEEEEEGEASHKADVEAGPILKRQRGRRWSHKETIPKVSVDVVEADVSAKKSLVRAESGIGNKEADLVSGNGTGDAAAPERRGGPPSRRAAAAEQKRVTLACFALADSPLMGKNRRCDSEAVEGMFKGNPCEGHEGEYFTPEAACGTFIKCVAKHVCLKTVDTGHKAVVEAADGSWQVNDNARCSEGSAAVVCVPRNGSYRLPPPLD